MCGCMCAVCGWVWLDAEVTTTFFHQAAQQNAAGVDPSHYYPQYVWITLGWYPQQWWTRGVTPDGQYTDMFAICSDAALEGMLHRALSVNHRPQPLNSTGKTDVYYVSNPLFINCIPPDCCGVVCVVLCVHVWADISTISGPHSRKPQHHCLLPSDLSSTLCL